jgi:hypothetical protein
MKYDHPNITVEEPKPGAFIIAGHRPATIYIPEVGHYAPPGECYIGPEIPADLLRAIADTKDGNIVVQPGEPGTTGEIGELSLAERVCNVLAEGNVRIVDLAERLGVDLEAIKAIDGDGFHIGHAGWVKLNAGGAA